MAEFRTLPPPQWALDPSNVPVFRFDPYRPMHPDHTSRHCLEGLEGIHIRMGTHPGNMRTVPACSDMGLGIIRSFTTPPDFPPPPRRNQAGALGW